MQTKRGEFELTAALERYHERIAEQHMAPLWQRLGGLLTPEPIVESVPHLWNYDGLRALALESADLITAEEAERRVLLLENPGLPGSSAITESLFAGLQIVMPGEIAPSHRHSPAALRFILEGNGAYTSVDGERLPMHPGDLIVTPSWSWHDHGHEGTGPFVWLDVLDLPTVRNSGAIFFEEYAEVRYPESRPPDDNLYRYGTNMAPAGVTAPRTACPLRTYPYARTREALEHLKQRSELDSCHGLKMEFIDPTSGQSAIPTISTFMQLLPAGFATSPYRSTEGAVFCVVEGSGTVTIENRDAQIEFRYAPRDIFVVPCWQSYAVTAAEESIFFSTSDRVIQQKLGIWRESR